MTRTISLGAVQAFKGKLEKIKGDRLLFHQETTGGIRRGVLSRHCPRQPTAGNLSGRSGSALLSGASQILRLRYRFKIYAYVLMPNHALARNQQDRRYRRYTHHASR
jgi:hypothetical protein